MADVLEINQLDELAPFQLTWNALYASTPEASFFQTYDWFQTYWRHYGEGQKLRVLIVRGGGRTIGIVPWCVRRERYKTGSVRVLTYPLHDWGPWYRAIGPDPAATMLMAMRHLRNTPRDWDVIDLRWCDPVEQDGGRTARAMRVAGFHPVWRPYQQTSIVDLRGGWDEYLANRSSKWRNNMRRQWKKLQSLGQLEFHRCRPDSGANGDGDAHWYLYDECVALAARSWQGNSQNGNTLSHETVRPFLRQAHQAAARLGMVDTCVMTIDARVAAFAYNYHWQGNVTGLRMGYDESISRHGLGTALLYQMLEDSCRRGDVCVDLGIGPQRFKQGFRTGVKQNIALRHCPLASWRGQTLRLAQWLKESRLRAVAGARQKHQLRSG